MPDPLKYTKALPCRLGEGKGEILAGYGRDGDEDDDDMEYQGAQSGNEGLGSNGTFIQASLNFICLLSFLYQSNQNSMW